MTESTSRSWPPRPPASDAGRRLPVPGAGPARRLALPPAASADAIRLYHRPRPFSPDVERLELPAGLTLAEMVERAQPDLLTRERCALLFDGEAVPRERWRRIRPKPGATLTLNVVPGDQQTALRATLILAVAVLAIAAPYAAPAGSAFAAGTLGGSLITVGIAPAGKFAVNALPPPARKIPHG